MRANSRGIMIVGRHRYSYRGVSSANMHCNYANFEDIGCMPHVFGQQFSERCRTSLRHPTCNVLFLIWSMFCFIYPCNLYYIITYKLKHNTLYTQLYAEKQTIVNETRQKLMIYWYWLNELSDRFVRSSQMNGKDVCVQFESLRFGSNMQSKFSR